MFFVYLYPHVVGCFFSVPLLVRVVQPFSWAGLLAVPASYLGHLVIFSVWDPVLLNGCPLEKLMLMGSKVYNLLSLVAYPKCVYFASLKPSAAY
jgi:hypothetical protein